MSMQVPCPLQSAGHDSRLHSRPSNPGMQMHIPVAWSHIPRVLHTVRAWAVSIADVSSDHENPSKHFRREQSPPIHPLKHWHLISVVEHSPCPEHKFGQAALAKSTLAKNSTEMKDRLLRFRNMMIQWCTSRRVVSQRPERRKTKIRCCRYRTYLNISGLRRKMVPFGRYDGFYLLLRKSHTIST